MVPMRSEQEEGTGVSFATRPSALRDENAISWQAIQQLQALLPKITDVQRLHISSVQDIVHFSAAHPQATRSARHWNALR